jgi:bifunctional UDP-N-acetylglucosamine pyrophosphorylase/glucosamine-1-phosphate N-acetyltransferase
MAASSLHVVVLAAGQGTRMRSRLPKVLHPLGGKPLLGHVLQTALDLGCAACYVVHGHGGDQLKEWGAKHAPAKLKLEWVPQAEQKGTGHAVLQAIPKIPDTAQVLVLYADVPLLRAATLQPLVLHKGVGLLTAVMPDPRGYGRIVRDEEKHVTAIVEDGDADAAQRAIGEINTGVLSAPARLLKRWLPKLRNSNAKREYYLTDVVKMAADEGVEVTAHAAADANEVLGVNDRAQLARVERLYQRGVAEELMRHGLHVLDPDRFELRGKLRHSSDVTIDIGVVLEGDVHLEEGVYVGPYCVLRNVKLGAGTRVESHSVLDSVVAGRKCRIGPFARLRPDTELGDDVHIGNFVEVKKTRVGAGSKANHLAYLGDGVVGAGVNVGAGTIFCNYDGANKHVTTIEDDVFIGSDTQLVAPVKVGKGATIGAGSTITKDVPPGGLTVARAKEQKTYEAWKRPAKKT